MFKRILQLLKIKGYKIYTAPYQLNIVGMRSPNTNSNKFDDELHVFFKNDNYKWIHYQFSITTDPGTYWLKNPLQVDGTAILKEGQYINAYHIGLHRGQYRALTQVKPVTVIRDYDRNAVLDFFNGKETTGLYGINIHKASNVGVTDNVNKWSAGCQVFANVNDFNLFMRLCDKHNLYNGNKFTYTLIDTRAIKRTTRRRIAYTIGGTLAAGGIAYLLYNYFSKS